MCCVSSRSGSVVLAMYGALSCDATLDAITLPLAVTVIVAIAVAVLSYKAVITLAVAGPVIVVLAEGVLSFKLAVGVLSYSAAV